MSNGNLQQCLDSGIINLSVVSELEEMKKREIIENHPYKIWEGSNGYWYTYLPDSTKSNGRRLVKKNTKDKIEDAIVEYHKDQEEKPNYSFKAMLEEFFELQKDSLSGNSIIRHHNDYVRFFEGTDFEKADIRTLDIDIVRCFFIKSCKEKRLKKRAFQQLFSMAKNAFRRAKIHHLIIDNPFDELDRRMFYKYCYDELKTTEKRTYNQDELSKLYEQLHRDYERNPSYLGSYAIELATLTGMRSGELSALTWDCTVNGVLFVNKAEVHDKINHKYIIDSTKNGIERKIPITPQIQELLDRIRKIQFKYDMVSKYVFVNKKGRIHSEAISHCALRKCRQIGMDLKGVHALRRTVSSNLKNMGVPTITVASMLGHSVTVNEQCYTYDMITTEGKRELLGKYNQEISST